jgi:DNA-binding transcriptional LysR family regulator
MELRHLRYFVAVADAGSFSRAADQLRITQPALSRQIHDFEAELGVRLFDRIGRRIQMTAEGEILLRQGRRVLADSESLAEQARTLEQGQTGLLRIGATPQNIEALLATFLTRYQRRHPGVEVQLIEDGAARLPNRLERGEVQLALIQASDVRFRLRPLFPIYLMAVLSPKHRLSRRTVLECEELADESLLLLRREFGSRGWFDAACQALHLRPRVLLESGAPQGLVVLASTGYGVAVVPSNVRLSAGLVRSVPLLQRGTPIGTWSVAACNPARFLAPYVVHFVDELVAYCRRTYPGRELTRRAPPLLRPKELANNDFTSPRAGR